MSFHTIYLTLAVTFLVVIYKTILYPALLSPLARIPNAHWSSSFSPIWIYWKRWSAGENAAVYDLHMTHGPVIRLAPDLLSVNCFEDGLKTIYQGGFPKPQFYANGFMVHGVDNIFTFMDNETHATRKKLISNIFSKSRILSDAAAHASMMDVVWERYLPIIYDAATKGEPLEVLELNYALSMDIFVRWQYGHNTPSNFLQNERERREYLAGFFNTHLIVFWQYYFPIVSNWLRKLNIYLIPAWVDEGFVEIENWNLNLCDKAQQILSSGQDIPIEDRPVVFEQAMKTMSNIDAKPSEYPSRLQISSEMFAYNSAAFETSGNNETYLFYEISRNLEWQTRLRKELLTLKPVPIFTPGHKVKAADLPSSKDLDTLPILNAVIMETLRLWPTVPGGQPRVVPRPCTLGGYHNIPTGTTVQSYAWTLHNTPSIFPEPRRWMPERWLNASTEELSTMKKWFWAFGSGTRMCIGSHFAYFSMKWAMAAVYTNFTTTIHDHGSMSLHDAYLSGPKGHRLDIKFHRIETGTQET